MIVDNTKALALKYEYSSWAKVALRVTNRMHGLPCRLDAAYKDASLLNAVSGPAKVGVALHEHVVAAHTTTPCLLRWTPPTPRAPRAGLSRGSTLGTPGN